MFLLQSRNPSTAGREYYNIAEIHVKDLRIGFMNMIEVLKEKTNLPLKEIYEKAID